MMLSTFKNDSLCFAVSIHRWLKSLQKLVSVDCNMAKKQIFHDTGHYFIPWNESCCQPLKRAQLGEMILVGATMGL